MCARVLECMCVRVCALSPQASRQRACPAEHCGMKMIHHMVCLWHLTRPLSKVSVDAWGGRIHKLRNLQNFAILAILEICEFLRNLRNFEPAIVLPAIPYSCMLGFFFLMSDIPPEEDALSELVAALDDDVADAPAKKKLKLNYGAKT